MLRLIAALALCLAPLSAGAQLLINGQPVGSNSAGWVAQQDVTLDATGNATWVFDTANLPPVVPAVVHLPKLMDTANPIICNWTARTQLLVSVHCWRSNTLSALLGGMFQGAVAGAQVTLVARAIP